MQAFALTFRSGCIFSGALAGTVGRAWFGSRVGYWAPCRAWGALTV